MTKVGNDCFNCITRHGDNLGVHGMLIGIRHLHRLESTCTYMQGEFGCLYALLAQAVEDIIREMQTRSRSRYRTFDARIDGLVGGFVALFGLAIEVWRDRQFAYGVEDLCKAEV